MSTYEIYEKLNFLRNHNKQLARQLFFKLELSAVGFLNFYST